MKSPRQIAMATAAGIIALQLPLPMAGAASPFEDTIRPILEKNCFSCHGPEKQKSGYRLDVKSIALTGGEEHAPNIVPGNAAASPLVKFISGADKDLVMPPKGPPLSPAEIETVKAWIDAGAPWPDSASASVSDPLDWWSLKPITKPTPPTVAGSPIDAFIQAKLAEHGLSPSPEADARTLCRRLYFDLTGLPPSPEEIGAFAADPSPQAYQRLVDQLLASPRYGERWSRHWLDVVHYGDTHGYDKDKIRPNAWPYRDYVIRALNSDKPYARFVQEQIAGDILFPDSPDGIEALGFISAGPWDFIGHAEVPETKTDGKIARHLDRDDMVANTMGTFVSITVHCAQCHNHKFDPIPQEDYYSLQAVFSALDRTERKYYRDGTLNARYQDLLRQQKQDRDALAALDATLRVKAGGALLSVEGPDNAAHGYHSAIAATPEETKWVQVDLGQSVRIGGVSLLPCQDDFNGIGAGFGFPVRFRIEASDDPEFRAGGQLLPQHHELTFNADFKNPGLTRLDTDGGKGEAGITGRYVRVTAVKLAPRQGDFIFALAEMKVLDRAGNNAALGRPVMALDSIETPPRWQKSNLTDGLAPADPSALPREHEALLLSFADESTRAERLNLVASTERLTAALKSLPPPDSVYAGGIHQGTDAFKGTGANGGQPRPVFLLARGQVTHPGREVRAGALSALTFAPARFALPPDAPEGARRAALAHWLTDPQNPLVWRSIVNRVWQYHFGSGLVNTPGDFGRNGARPSHPDLLDWLASDFLDRGGSLKMLHRQIVTSATYRQATVSNAAAEKIDSGNTLLWRQNRRKLEAESVRDAVLAVSGKLDLTMGGPGWQDFVIERPEHSPHYLYSLADPGDPKTWRRSIYRCIVRSQTQPWMTSLDCADPSMRVDQRNESLSPLQALALLNNGFILTQAQHFATRVQRERPDLPAQVSRAHELAFGRLPDATALEPLVDFARANGLPALCRVLFNLNEFTFTD